MTRLAVIVMWGVAALTGGCFGSSATDAPAPAAPRAAVISGLVATEGGPPTAHPSGSDLRGMTEAPVVVVGRTDTGDQLSRSLNTDSSGHFRVSVPPGRYIVATFFFSSPGVMGLISSPTRHPDSRQLVTVAAGDAVRVELKLYLI
jgi:hypothetical protein